MNPFFSAVIVSLSVSVLSTAASAVVGVPLGCLLALVEFRGKRAVLSVLNTMLALPTVVVGLLVYALLSRHSLFGGLGLLFTRTAIVIGQVILVMPLMITFTHAAVASVQREASETARTLGAGPASLVQTMISEARFGILAAVAAVFGRLIGEVGVSMMVGGNIAGYTRTMTTSIALETSKGEFGLGLKLGAVLMGIALGVNVVLRYFQGRAVA